MKTKHVILAIAAFTVTGKLFAQSGSLEIDTDLKSINIEASADFGKFKTEIGTTFNVSEKKITELHASLQMSPADIYMTLECGRLTGKSVDEVVAVYKANKGKGWGVIAKELGIKPGSKEFHELKANVKTRADKGKSKGKGTGHGNGKKKH
ncbi:MAG TPA: hypothetical protein P5349_10685 [Tenuifilaceae bacterium]|nr:hypothetical protein [Tenuifilaceae bacterium]